MTAQAIEPAPVLPPPARQILVEDPRADHHQVIIRTDSYRSHEIVVSCTCRQVTRDGRPYYTPIEARLLFPAPALIGAWVAWHLAGGGT